MITISSTLNCLYFLNMLRLLFCLVLISSPIFAASGRSSLFNKLHGILFEEIGSESGILYHLDFTDQAGASSPLDWFKKKGFAEKFASKLNLGFRDDGIMFEATKSRTAVFLKQQSIPGAKKMRIVWKVLHYPSGANWETGKSNSAISVNVAFGEEKFPSGHFFLPAAPYFFSLFPGKNEPAGKSYQHKYYRNTSRHICVSSGTPVGEWITTEYELPQSFQNTFGVEMPTVSGFGIAVHTNAASKALIQSIEFLN